MSVPNHTSRLSHITQYRAIALPGSLDHPAILGGVSGAGLKAEGPSPPLEDLEHLAPTPGRCRPRQDDPAWDGARNPTGLWEIAESLRPLANGRGADAESPGDLGLRETASAEQATGREPTLLELFPGELVWSPHA